MVNGRKKGSYLCEHEESAMFQRNTGTKHIITVGMTDGQLASKLHECPLMKQENLNGSQRGFADMIG